MGNICRSPTAEGVLRKKAGQASCQLEIDSAGTHGYHIGEHPDNRATRAASKRGYDISSFCARKVLVSDFDHYDYILAMDKDNLGFLQHYCPPKHLNKLRLFLEFAKNSETLEVPDPYYGGDKGFKRVLDLIEDAADGLIEHICK